MYRSLYNEAARRATAADAAAEVLRAQLERSEHERTDLQLKLLRVGFGVNPFAEMFASDPAASAQPESPIPSPQVAEVHSGMSDDQIRETFIREAANLYGNNIRAIQKHVEHRQAEYYATRQQPSIVSPKEMAQALKVAADLEAAIEEGRREAEREQ